MKPMVMLFVMLVSGCGWAAPDAGHEAVLVMKPWFFGHGGVDREAVKTGRTLIAFSTEAHEVDMRPQQRDMSFDDFMSKDGVPLDFSSVMRVQVTDSVALIEKFGGKIYDYNLDAEFTNRVRQAVRKYGMNEMAIDTKAIDAVDAEVTAALNQYIKDAGLPVKLVQVTVGRANPPDSIKDQRIETATQEQRRMTEQQRKLAEDQRKAAEISRADADNAYRNTMGLSPAQFIQLEAIKMCEQAVCNFVSTGVLPTFEIPRLNRDAK